MDRNQHVQRYLQELREGKALPPVSGGAGGITPGSQVTSSKRRFVSVPLPIWTATGTSLFAIMALPDHPLATKKIRIVLKKITYVTGTVPAFGTTGLLNIFKKSIGVAAVQLVTSLSLAAGITANEVFAVAFDATVTLAQRTLSGLDSLYGTLVAGSTVSTNPAANAQVITVEYEPVHLEGETVWDADGKLIAA